MSENSIQVQNVPKKFKFKKIEKTAEDEIKNIDGLCYLESLNNETINLVLTDPPYITSRKTGMDEQAKIVQKYSESKKNIKSEEDWKKFKTDEEWEKWMIKNNITDESKKKKELAKLKNNYLKYGSIYGKKYAVVTDYGDWDNNFTMEILEKFITHYFRVLKMEVLIIFFDI